MSSRCRQAPEPALTTSRTAPPLTRDSGEAAPPPTRVLSHRTLRSERPRPELLQGCHPVPAEMELRATGSEK